jgi:hypothetical protein
MARESAKARWLDALAKSGKPPEARAVALAIHALSSPNGTYIYGRKPIAELLGRDLRTVGRTITRHLEGAFFDVERRKGGTMILRRRMPEGGDVAVSLPAREEGGRSYVPTSDSSPTNGNQGGRDVAVSLGGDVATSHERKTKPKTSIARQVKGSTTTAPPACTTFPPKGDTPVPGDTGYPRHLWELHKNGTLPPKFGAGLLRAQEAVVAVLKRPELASHAGGEA